LDYFKDHDEGVREKAFFILLEIPNEKHIEAILNSVQE
jgi:HEAT repeat protein